MADPYVPEDTYQERLATCKACHLWDPRGLCKGCGCFMSIRARGPRTQCPIGAWRAHPPEA